MQLQTVLAKRLQQELTRLGFQRLPDEVAKALDSCIKSIEFSSSPDTINTQQQKFNGLVIGQLQSGTEALSQLKILNRAWDLWRSHEDFNDSKSLPKIAEKLELGLIDEQAERDEDVAKGVFENEILRYSQYLQSIGLDYGNLSKVQEHHEKEGWQERGDLVEVFFKPGLIGISIVDKEKFTGFLEGLKENLPRAMNDDEHGSLWLLLEDVSNDHYGHYKSFIKGESSELNDSDFISNKTEYQKILDLYKDLGVEHAGLKSALDAAEQGIIHEHSLVTQSKILAKHTLVNSISNLHTLYEGDENAYRNQIDRFMRVINFLGNNSQSKGLQQQVIDHQITGVKLAITNMEQGDANKSKYTNVLPIAKEYLNSLQQYKN